MSIRAAIIGCGDIAGRYDEIKNDSGCYTHAGAYSSTDKIEITAAADPDANRLSAFGEFWKVPNLYADVIDLLRNQPVDLVSVCVPDALHEEVINQVLSTQPPRIIFAEKPLALSSRAARRLLDRAHGVGTRIVLNNQRRWEQGHLRARSLIQNGEIGEVATVTAYYVKGLYHIGCTAVDTIRFLVSEVDRVQALEGDPEAASSRDASLDAALYLDSGATGVILGLDRYGYRYSLFEIDILGTTGRIRIVENGDRILWFGIKEYSHYPGFLELREACEHEISCDMGSAIANGVYRILEILTNPHDTSDSDGEEGYRDLCVLDAIVSSKAQNCVSLPVKYK